jgi:hypothetical protein
MAAPKKLHNKITQWIHSFQISMGYKITRPKHNVICDQTFILPCNLKNIFDEKPDVKNISINSLTKFAASWNQNFTTGPATCYLIQIVIVHGGVRESQPGYSERQIAIWSMLFFKFL